MLDANNPAHVERAAEILRSGGLVAFPTETVYGLGARGLDPASVAKIFAAKGRPAENPIILHVINFGAARPLWRDVTDPERRSLAACERLATQFWPGPLTLVNYRSRLVPPEVAAGFDKIGVRAPDHPAALELLRRVAEPIAAPSANASGRVSPTSAADVLESLEGKIDAVLDGGRCPLGVESTVLDITKTPPSVLRPGALSEEVLRNAIPNVEFASGADGREASPGLLAKHYAPLVENRMIADPADLGREWRGGAAMLLRGETFDKLIKTLGPRAAANITERLPDDPEGFARELYAALYRIERARPRRLAIERPPDSPAWRAVRDRCVRAAAADR